MPPQAGRFAGKVVFVTGAAGGIGRATAQAFAREGASVVVADITGRDNRDTARMIEESGGRALAVQCDVTQAEDVKAALDQLVAAFGHLDIAFNNAGIEQAPKLAAETTENEWDRILAINLRAMFLCLKHEIPLMLRQGGGAIVNTSSGAGSRASERALRTRPPNSAWSASPSRQRLTMRRPASGSTPSARGSSTPP